MKILGIEASSNPASCAVSQDGRILAEFYLNNKKTHSQTLLGMIDSVKNILTLDLEELDAIAISKGPGSFTGLRIGSATAKGMAMALEKPIVEISTLEMMAFQHYGFEGIICPIMDARRSEVYVGMYRFSGEELVNVLGDQPLHIDDVIEKVNSSNEKIMFLGDGVPVHRGTLDERLTVDHKYALGYHDMQHASALCILAERYAEKGIFTDPDMHRPEYLRMSQAERERAEKMKKQESD